MSKYCGKCGTVINESTGLCPNCNVEFNKQVFNKEGSNKTSNNKGNKFKKIIALCLVLVVLAGTVGVLLCTNIIKLPNKSTSNSTEKSIIVNINSIDYYFSGLTVPLILNADNTIERPTIIDDSDESGDYRISRYNSVFDGNSFFAGLEDNREGLYKFTFQEDGSIKKSVWINKSSLKNSDIFKEKEDCYPQIMTNWQLDGEYIYFSYIPGADYFNIEKNDAYRLGKIKKDGSNIEFIGNTVASDYAVKDGWIYFYDNGFTCEGSDDCSYDNNREGLYKMRVDGTDRHLIYGELERASDYNRKGAILISDIKIYGEYLYFIDHSADGESRICRMNKEGKDKEYVTDDGAFSYTIDDKMEYVYYSTGKYGYSTTEPRTISVSSLNGDKKAELFEYRGPGNPYFTYYKNYLYFDNPSLYIIGTNYADLCGMRYDLNEKKLYYLNGYSETNVSFNELGIPIITKKHPVFYWEENSDSTDKKRNTEVFEETTNFETTGVAATEKPKEETTQVTTETRTDYSKYIGSWRKEYPDSGGASVWINIESVNENTVTFCIGNTSRNLAHITQSNKITSAINDDGEVNFTFNDTFCNYGTGYIKFKDNSIYLKTTFDEYYRPHIWALHADEELTRSL